MTEWFDIDSPQDLIVPGAWIWHIETGSIGEVRKVHTDSRGYLGTRYEMTVGYSAGVWRDCLPLLTDAALVRALPVGTIVIDTHAGEEAEIITQVGMKCIDAEEWLHYLDELYDADLVRRFALKSLPQENQ